MHTTSPTLLQKLRDPSDAAAWDRFVDLYLPLLMHWARRIPARGAEPADLVQEVFVKLTRELPKFNYEPARGRFRCWLRTLCGNQWRDYQKKRANQLGQADAAQLDGLPAADDGLEQFWNREYTAFVLREAFKIVEGEFDATSRTVFTEVIVNGRPVNDVAQALGVRPNAVSMRKFRVLRRLRRELGGFLE
jgi:RNA polymerase sigma-70 factor, ECF subfamily